MIDGLVRSLPRTPAELRGKLGRPLHLEEHGKELIAFAPPCPMGRAFRSIERGGGLNVLFPAVAKALEDCHCQMANLDGFVSILFYAGMPWPDGGYLVVDAAAFKHLPADATVADLAAALAAKSKPKK
jgi:hypothetical protein